jgi:hypothetical protein
MTSLPDAYLSHGKTMEPLSHSRFGMTFARLTESRGEELLTLCLAAFPARTLAQPEGAQESPESAADSGWKWPESWVKYNRVSCLWKTRQHSLLGDWVEFSETWPRWGSMRNGECWGLPMWERRTSETESGYWPTPTAHNAKEAAYPAEFNRKTPSLAAEVQMRKWPTPQASDNRDRGNTQSKAVLRRIEKGKQISLSQSVSPVSGALNPNWTEWLMGWPIGHTDLKPSETAKCQPVRLKHSAG